MNEYNTGNFIALAPIIHIALFTFANSLWYLSKFTIPRNESTKPRKIFTESIIHTVLGVNNFSPVSPNGE